MLPVLVVKEDDEAGSEAIRLKKVASHFNPDKLFSMWGDGREMIEKGDPLELPELTPDRFDQWRMLFANPSTSDPEITSKPDRRPHPLGLLSPLHGLSKLWGSLNCELHFHPFPSGFLFLD